MCNNPEWLTSFRICLKHQSSRCSTGSSFGTYRISLTMEKDRLQQTQIDLTRDGGWLIENQLSVEILFPCRRAMYTICPDSLVWVLHANIETDLAKLSKVYQSLVRENLPHKLSSALSAACRCAMNHQELLVMTALLRELVGGRAKIQKRCNGGKTYVRSHT